MRDNHKKNFSIRIFLRTTRNLQFRVQDWKANSDQLISTHPAPYRSVFTTGFLWDSVGGVAHHIIYTLTQLRVTNNISREYHAILMYEKNNYQIYDYLKFIPQNRLITIITGDFPLQTFCCHVLLEIFPLYVFLTVIRAANHNIWTLTSVILLYRCKLVIFNCTISLPGANATYSCLYTLLDCQQIK